jgi:hypothetical protein
VSLGNEQTMLELAEAVSDIRQTLNTSLGTAPVDFKTQREEWNAWHNARLGEFLRDDPRYRLLLLRHGPEVMADLEARHQRCMDSIKTAADVAEIQARYAREMAGDLPPVPQNVGFEEMLLLQEIAADSERVAEQHELGDRLDRFERLLNHPTEMRTYDDLAHCVTTLYDTLGDGLLLPPDSEVIYEPNSEEWHDYITDLTWDTVMADPRFLALQRTWGMQKIHDALQRSQEFERLWFEQVMRPLMEHRRGQPDEPDSVILARGRQHSTLRRMLASQAGLTETLEAG